MSCSASSIRQVDSHLLFAIGFSYIIRTQTPKDAGV